MDAVGALYIPPAFTHLHGSAPYGRLEPRQQRRYNQLCGLMAAEQFLAFEETVIIDAVARLARSPRVRGDPGLAEALAAMLDEERHHAQWFRTLLREAEPGLYGAEQRPFTRLRWWERAALVPLTRTDQGALLLLWFTLLIEEHSVALSRAMLADADGLDPRFVAVHRRHLRDEERHLPLNLRLIACCYDPLPAWRRRLLAAVFRRVLRDIARPRRANTAVIRRLLAEFPDLAPRRRELLAAVRETFRDHAPLSDITHPRSHPLTVQALAGRTEFAAVSADLEHGVNHRADGPGRRLAIVVGLQLAGCTAYTLIAQFTLWRMPQPPAVPLTAIDRALPQLPAMLLAYDSLGLFLLLPAWSHAAGFARFVRATLLTSAAAYLCFLASPMRMERGPLPADEPWRTGFALLHAADLPVNTFPSLHVAYAVLVLCACARWTARPRMAVAAWGLLVMASAVMTGQHGVLDATAGVLLALLCWRVARGPDSTPRT